MMLPRGNNNDDNRKEWGKIVWISSLGIHLVLTTAVGGIIGYGLDKLFHTTPICMLIFLVIGMVAGFREIIREAKRMNEKEDKEDHSK